MRFPHRSNNVAVSIEIAWVTFEDGSRLPVAYPDPAHADECREWLEAWHAAQRKQPA